MEVYLCNILALFVILPFFLIITPLNAIFLPSKNHLMKMNIVNYIMLNTIKNMMIVILKLIYTFVQTVRNILLFQH